MADRVSEKKRSYMMAQVKSRDTKPEKLVRSTLHRMGYRFRLHQTNLPGTPDIVLPRHRKVIRVNGCFWHQHQNCKRAKRPTSNKEFWNNKLDETIIRDKKNHKLLKQGGWGVLTIWECEIEDLQNLESTLLGFLR